ncbi:hypothetical protein [uncultured Tateyamaria sp.]|uniref:hypothetical protein n=1 Tax=uncultured Tateyamaria sp. TaxID=455651 RepID=UPI0026370260|nr:hypothetical protein [uncultured Tateyamaria sp.]
MARTCWHILHEGGRVTLCRHLPPRFDFAVRTMLPGGRAVRLAHQIRQDLWRALQNVRGYSVVVQLDRRADGWQVTAGGHAARAVLAAVVAQAQAVLNDPRNHARWVRSAGGVT